jgi:hypothetical protein
MILNFLDKRREDDLLCVGLPKPFFACVGRFKRYAIYAGGHCSALAVTQLLPPVISCNIVHLQPLAVPHASRASPPASPLNAAVGVGASSNVPSEWICPLSNKLMTDPVTGMCFICPYILVSFVLTFWFHLSSLHFGLIIILHP